MQPWIAKEIDIVDQLGNPPTTAGMHIRHYVCIHALSGYIYQVIKEAFLEVFHDGRLLDLYQEYHVLHPTRLLASTLPVVCLQHMRSMYSIKMLRSVQSNGYLIPPHKTFRKAACIPFWIRASFAQPISDEGPGTAVVNAAGRSFS